MLFSFHKKMDWLHMTLYTRVLHRLGGPVRKSEEGTVAVGGGVEGAEKERSDGAGMVDDVQGSSSDGVTL